MIAGQIRGKKVIVNNIAADVSELNIEASADIYYEVVRVTEGKFMFLPDHLERLKRSLTHSELEYPGSEAFRMSLRLLLSISEEQTGNVKVSVFREEGKETSIVTHFVTHLYPTLQMYREGVKLLTFKHTRPQPGVKKWDGDFRKRVNEFISGNQIYEAILVNELGEITEGSRSNLFFINHNGKVITPLGGTILQGITRKYVIDILHKLKVPYCESTVKAELKSSFASCFLTGTSPRVLPVKSLDDVKYLPDHPILRAIMESYNSIIPDHFEEL